MHCYYITIFTLCSLVNFAPGTDRVLFHRDRMSPDDLLKQKKTRYDQNGQVIFSTPFFDKSAESDEHQPSTLDQILENLFNVRRWKKVLLDQHKETENPKIIQTNCCQSWSFVQEREDQDKNTA